jgi:hypothetical protein
MALFGFSDIKFNSSSGPVKGPLAALEGTQFEKNTYRYPIDVGSTDKAHYMVIYIRQQNKTQYPGTTVDGIPPDNNNFGLGGSTNKNSLMGALKAAQDGKLASHFGSEIIGKVNSGLSQINNATNGALSGITSSISKGFSGAVSGLDNMFGQATASFTGSSGATQAFLGNSIQKITNKSFLQTTSLTTDAIALYMPDTLNYTYDQGYDAIDIGNELGGKILGGGASAVDAFKSGESLGDAVKKAAASSGKSIALTAGQKVSEVAGSLGVGQNTARLGFTAVTGAVQNPMLEMIYKSPNFRSFTFDFMFYPRDEFEALEVQRIIERLRFHQAPERIQDAQAFLIPPSEFDIKFYYGGAQNPNIPPISTCVLKTIDVNYAPNGFTAYEVPGQNNPSLGRTGMPVAIQVQLQFQETSYLTKEDYRNDQGVGTVGMTSF